jgi:hypothetical protein
MSYEVRHPQLKVGEKEVTNVAYSMQKARHGWIAGAQQHTTKVDG